MALVGGDRVTLNDGREMPVVGLGTWKSKPGEVKAAVLAAVRAGYRHIDCAPIYKNEDEVGAALKELFEEGVVKREDLWITSKLWNDKHRAEDVPRACAQTLSDLGVDYLDLFLIHWPVTGNVGDFLNPSIEETWGAMQKLQADGIARSIGVSNFSAKKLADMKPYAKVFPAVNQVELHPIWKQDALKAAAAEIGGCHLTAYSPLGSPDSSAMIGHKGASVLDNEVVKKIAEEIGKTTGQVVLRWGVQRGTSVVPKSVTPSRIEGNFDLFGWELTEEQMTAISSLPQERMLHGSFWVKKDGPYKTVADLWDE